MTRGYVPLLVSLAAIWGASYLFIKVAVEDFEPTTMMAIRLGVAGVILLAFLAWRAGWRQALGEITGAWREGFLLGVINGAVPFTLIAWGEKHIDSGVAGIGVSTVPIFVALLAFKFRPSERSGGARLAGIVLGLLGVGLLAAGRPEGGWWAVIGTLAVVGAAFSYACSSLYGQHRTSHTSSLVLATAMTLAGGLVLLPFALVQLPHHLPSLTATGSLAGLTVLGTALAQLLFFRLLRLYGSARTSLVSYLIPGVALLYGSLLLDEKVTLSVVGGLALILLGVALGSGVLRFARAPAPSPLP